MNLRNIAIAVGLTAATASADAQSARDQISIVGSSTVRRTLVLSRELLNTLQSLLQKRHGVTKAIWPTKA